VHQKSRKLNENVQTCILRVRRLVSDSKFWIFEILFFPMNKLVSLVRVPIFSMACKIQNINTIQSNHY